MSKQHQILNFRPTDVTRQHNGTTGRPFYVVRFSCLLDGKFMPNMAAVLPDDNDEPSIVIECYVLDLNDVGNCWRGAEFCRHVKDVVAEFEHDSQRALRAIKKAAVKPPSDRG